MALKSGQMANLYVPQKTFDLAAVYLDRARTTAGGQYGYHPGHRATPAMTAEALLCRQYLGWPKDHPGLKAGVEYLLERHARRRGHEHLLLVLRHASAAPLGRRRVGRMERPHAAAAGRTQVKDGHAAGSWTPRAAATRRYADRGGRLYMTALAVCTLEVYYRHLPLYGEEVMEPLEFK